MFNQSICDVVNFFIGQFVVLIDIQLVTLLSGQMLNRSICDFVKCAIKHFIFDVVKCSNQSI